MSIFDFICLPLPGFEFSLPAPLVYLPKFKKAEMATDWEVGRPPDLVFCEVFHRGQVVPGVKEGWTFFSMQKDAPAWANCTLDADSIQAWRIPKED